jgi:hypothetical protein
LICLKDLKTVAGQKRSGEDYFRLRVAVLSPFFPQNPAIFPADE